MSFVIYIHLEKFSIIEFKLYYVLKKAKQLFLKLKFYQLHCIGLSAQVIDKFNKLVITNKMKFELEDN